MQCGVHQAHGLCAVAVDGDDMGLERQLRERRHAEPFEAARLEAPRRCLERRCSVRVAAVHAEGGLTRVVAGARGAKAEGDRSKRADDLLLADRDGPAVAAGDPDRLADDPSFAVVSARDTHALGDGLAWGQHPDAKGKGLGSEVPAQSLVEQAKRVNFGRRCRGNLSRNDRATDTRGDSRVPPRPVSAISRSIVTEFPHGSRSLHILAGEALARLAREEEVRSGSPA